MLTDKRYRIFFYWHLHLGFLRHSAFKTEFRSLSFKTIKCVWGGGWILAEARGRARMWKCVLCKEASPSRCFPGVYNILGSTLSTGQLGSMHAVTFPKANLYWRNLSVVEQVLPLAEESESSVPSPMSGSSGACNSCSRGPDTFGLRRCLH